MVEGRSGTLKIRSQYLQSIYSAEVAATIKHTWAPRYESDLVVMAEPTFKSNLTIKSNSSLEVIDNRIKHFRSNALARAVTKQGSSDLPDLNDRPLMVAHDSGAGHTYFYAWFSRDEFGVLQS